MSSLKLLPSDLLKSPRLWLAALLIFGVIAASGSLLIPKSIVEAVPPPLFGVTGEGVAVPESFFSINRTDASTTLIQALGNGGDGESIAFNPADGLMYHWSGNGGTQIMETINLSNQTVTNVPINLSSYDPIEVFGSTHNPSSGNFLFTDINGNLGSVTPGGVFSLIGAMPCPGACGGLAFNDGKLYSVDRNNDQLREINPLTGGGLSSVTVTSIGLTVNGINTMSTAPDTLILYGIIAGRLMTIDPLTGVGTNINILDGGFVNIEFEAVSLPDPHAPIEAKLDVLEIKVDEHSANLNGRINALEDTLAILETKMDTLISLIEDLAISKGQPAGGPP